MFNPFVRRVNGENAAALVKAAYTVGYEMGRLSDQEYILSDKPRTAVHTIEKWADELEFGRSLGCSGIGCSPDCPGRK